MRHFSLRPIVTCTLSRRTRLALMAGGSALVLAACDTQPLDLDLRGNLGDFSTAQAATAPLADRPRPDSRGVISYPTYQVAVARRGDTLADVARRVGADTAQLARYNGIDPSVPLRKDEIIALPNRVAEPTSGGSAGNTPVDISSLAGSAIDRAPAAPGVQTASLPPSGTTATDATPAPETKEPVRHRVERGETAYTVARLYNVPVKALAEWNGLGADFGVREGQFLLIPVAQQAAPARTAALEPQTTLPGAGSPTPTPPSAAKPLPSDEAATKPRPVAQKPAAQKPVADVGPVTKASPVTKMLTPVQGSIIRGYTKGKNEGINIKAEDGAPVKAADTGTVAAITKSAEGVPIVVLRHQDNLLTVYANVTDVSVEKGDQVKRGDQIASLRTGTDAYVHFEVRQGFDSVDPTPFIQQ